MRNTSKTQTTRRAVPDDDDRDDVITDWFGNTCTDAEENAYAQPLLAVVPELDGSYSTPQIVMFAKRLEQYGLRFS